MNEVFKQISLMAGGSHYPNINPDLQQKFGEAIIKRIVKRIEDQMDLAYDCDEPYTVGTLQALAIEILHEFDIEMDEEE